MKRIIVIVLALMFSSFAARGQKVCEWSNGLAWQPPFYKGTSGIGWVAKRYFNDKYALDLGLFYYTNKKGSEINAMFDWTLAIPFVKGLSFFGGPGIHVGAVSPFGGEDAAFRHITYGVMAGAGLEYKIPKIPLMVALDWRPRLTFRTGYGDHYMGWDCICLSVKFCID